MGKVLKLLGVTWSLPVTLVAFVLYVLPCWVLGWYSYIGWRDLAWVWVHSDKMPAFLLRLWGDWLGQTFGTLIVLKVDPSKSELAQRIFTHESEHARQGMVLGVFQPLMYGFLYVMIKLFVRNAHPYYDNVFEIAARRSAGQLVDIWGTVLKLKAKESASPKV